LTRFRTETFEPTARCAEAHPQTKSATGVDDVFAGSIQFVQVEPRIVKESPLLVGRDGIP
jgi:hypothetical protein